MASISIGNSTIWNNATTGLWHRFLGSESLGPNVTVVGLPLGGEYHRVTRADGVLLTVECAWQVSNYTALISQIGALRGVQGQLNLPDFGFAFPRCTFLGAVFGEPTRQASGDVIVAQLQFRHRA